MEQLGRFNLSVILSFLHEEEGTSLLICRKEWSKKLLPIFRLPESKSISIVNANNNKNNNAKSSSKSKLKRFQNRHKFLVIPVQDATVRLDRLNTRRWKQQSLSCQGYSTCEYTKMRLDEFALQQQQQQQQYPCHDRYPPLLQFYDEIPSTSPFKVFRDGITLLASYPRSGNTLLRSLLESVTGIVTGSDTRPDRTLSLALANAHDLVGEGCCTFSNTPIVKTHWPERIGFQRYRAHRVILLVRNPFDAIDSYWNLNLTNTHTQKVTEQVYQDHVEFFESLALNEMKVWLDFINFWCAQSTQSNAVGTNNNDSHQQGISIHWVRYEDLILDPQTTLLQILQFATNPESSSPSYWEEAVSRVTDPNHSHGYSQRRQSSTHKKPTFGSSLSHYSPQLLQHMHQIDQDGWLERLGYHMFHQDFPNNTSNLPPLPSTRIQNETIHTHAQTSTPNGSATKGRGILVNKRGLDLRPPNCPFGRNMYEWRRRHTNDDLEPFPTTATAGRARQR